MTPDPLTIHQVVPGAMAARTVTVVGDMLTGQAVPGDVAILTRVNSALLPVQVALGEAGIPRTCPLDVTVLGRTGIRTALAYLRIGLEPERIRRDDILETINRPSRKVKRAVEPQLRRRPQWTLDGLDQIADLLDGAAGERFAAYVADLRLLAAAATDRADTATMLRLIRTGVGLGEAMDALDASRTRPEGSSHTDDLDALDQLAMLQPDPVQFREWLVESLRHPGDADGVTLSTVHRVKGMEWDHVVVFAANQGLMPHRLAEDIEEERRIFHVAVTRCRRSVAVIASSEAPSPFVAQLHRASRQPTPTPTGRGSPEPRPARWAGDEVRAEGGLVVGLPGGIEARIVAVEPGAVRALTASGVELSLPFGEPVLVEGRVTQLARRPDVRPPARPQPRTLAGMAPPGLVEALKTWRLERARSDAVPPYVILHDAHLEEIARQRPATLRALATCPGIGPTKLERYGDELLELLASGGLSGPRTGV